MSALKKLLAGAVVAGVIAVAGWAVLGRGEPHQAPFLTAAVERGTVIQSVTATGTLTAVTTVKVGSQVSGIIASLHADFNDKVKKGQIVAVLDPTPFQAQVDQTAAQLERARVGALDTLAKMRRHEALFAAQLLSEDQLDSARAAHNQANAQVAELSAALERAEANMRYSIIRSPIDGVVVSRDYDVGQTVAASFQAPTLFTIAEDLARMQLTCDIDEADIGQVKVAQPVRFAVDTFPEREFLGRVSQIRLAPKTTNNVVTYPVIAEVENRDGTLLPGMTAEVRIQVARAEDVLRVPASALRFRPELLGLTGRPGSGPPRSGGAEGGDARPAGMSHGQPAASQRAVARLYLAPANPAEAPVAVAFTPGLSDGQFVEVRGGDIEEGQKIVIGLATTQSQEMGGLAGMNPFGRRR